MVYALGLGPSGSNPVGVQVLSPAPICVAKIFLAIDIGSFPFKGGIN